ncbi:MAG: FIST C-terminal domain-containing protein [Deltaproteobacteria bacterium]|nr:FIST C-terminal domain-containing protein [Deltaproteobacteria bacterium]
MFKAATTELEAPFSENKGRRLGEGLVDKLGQTPDACWLFCSAQRGIKDLLKGVNDTVNTDTLVGCTTDGEISNEGFSSDSAVLTGIVTDRITFHLSVVENLSQDSEGAGGKLAQGLPKSIRYLQLFSDGITGNGCAILRGISSVLGEKIPVSGGTAGDGGRFVETWQFAGRKILTDAAVAIGFSGDFKLGTGVRSGWTPIGLSKKVTHSAGNILYQLNGEPALKVFERFLGKHAHKLPEIGVEYPLGLVGRSGDVGEENYYLLRATMSVNRKEGSIRFAGEIPEGAEVSLTCGDIASVLYASEEAARLAISDLGDATVAMIFCYSCMARKLILGNRTREEIELIRQKIGPHLPITGFYSYGEYSPMRCGGANYLHNETSTVSVIGF